MTDLVRARLALTGFPGGPGVATFYFIDNAGWPAALRSLALAMAQVMPPTVLITEESTGDLIEDTTGNISGSWANAAVAGERGVGGASYAAPTGLCMTWRTAGIIHGHHVRGRTFVVPCSAEVFESDGSASGPKMAILTAAGAALVANQGVNFVVWSRPFAGTVATPTRRANPARAGSHSVVTGVTVADKAAVLRSRRD